MKQHSFILLVALSVVRPSGAADLPPTLAETGLWSDPSTHRLAPGVLEFEPHYPLWTDGLEKRRWISIPTGSAIDASDPDHLVFPIGTKVWKQFGTSGQPIETRFIERTSSGWRFAAYVWEAGEAVLAPSRGLKTAVEVAPGQRHEIPGRYDCLACHDLQAQPVLGFSAVQLAPRVGVDSLDLDRLAAAGLLVGLDPALRRPAPDVPAAIGYLHGNCGHCHNAGGALASVGLDLQLRIGDRGRPFSANSTTFDRPASASARSASAPLRAVPGNPFESQLLQRVNNRDPLAQMPPLGTKVVDTHGVELLTTWIREAPSASRP